MACPTHASSPTHAAFPTHVAFPTLVSSPTYAAFPIHVASPTHEACPNHVSSPNQAACPIYVASPAHAACLTLAASPTRLTSPILVCFADFDHLRWPLIFLVILLSAGFLLQVVLRGRIDGNCHCQASIGDSKLQPREKFIFKALHTKQQWSKCRSSGSCDRGRQHIRELDPFPFLSQAWELLVFHWTQRISQLLLGWLARKLKWGQGRRDWRLMPVLTFQWNVFSKWVSPSFQHSNWGMSTEALWKAWDGVNPSRFCSLGCCFKLMYQWFRGNESKPSKAVYRGAVKLDDLRMSWHKDKVKRCGLPLLTEIENSFKVAIF